MRIVHIIPDLSRGGITRICIDLCDYLSHENEVYLITLCKYKDEMLPLSFINEKIHFVNFHKKKGLHLRLLWETYKGLRGLAPEVLHLHSQGLFYSILYIIVPHRTKIFYTVHSLANKDAPWPYRVVYKQLFRFFNIRLIPISEAVKRSILDHYKVKSEKVIYHGVNMDFKGGAFQEVKEEIKKYKKSPETKVFVHLARISNEKNQYLLVESFNQLIKEKIDILLLIIGGARENALLNKLKSIAGDYIFFLGSKDNICDYLKIADAFCLTSKYEGLSLATIEAMAMKVVPICTPVGGVLEVVQDGYNGFLSEDCSIDSYARALQRFIAMDEPSKEIIRYNAFHTYLKKFTMKKCVEEHLTLYYNLAEKYEV